MGWVAFKGSVAVQALNPEREEVNSSTEESSRAFTSQRSRGCRGVFSLGYFALITRCRSKLPKHPGRAHQCLAEEGKPIPTELRNKEAELRWEIDLEDENCRNLVSATSPDLAVKWLACALGDTLPCVPISYLVYSVSGYSLFLNHGLHEIVQNTESVQKLIYPI
ncbi:hypothetical protein RHMOL_Rhmol05G0023300 [Rhododendron molle]|uniref:Uncharacterized protein n=1 Tax=Rhododendron molle TaxID=49168 RepID=A0ACC0NLS4_RHOML|nr:hypothetical protein RHMOL_Rhmol05G0023300 [Rhododendron molle]